MTDKKAKSPPRAGRFPIRLADEERAEFQRKATEAGSPSLAAYLRECILSSQVVARPKPSVDRKRMLFLMNKASNNINQLAHQVNAAHMSGVISEGTYLRILFNLDALTTYIKRTVGYVD